MGNMVAFMAPRRDTDLYSTPQSPDQLVSARGCPRPGNKRQVIHLTASLFLFHANNEEKVKNKNEYNQSTKFFIN